MRSMPSSSSPPPSPPEGGSGGGIQYNTGSTTPTIADAEESGADPFGSYIPMTLTTVPEPATIMMLCLAAFYVLLRVPTIHCLLLGDKRSPRGCVVETIRPVDDVRQL